MLKTLTGTQTIDTIDTIDKIVVKDQPTRLVQSAQTALFSQLKTLIIGFELQLNDATMLSTFTALTELQLPNTTTIFPQLSQLNTLHTSTASSASLSTTDNALNFYKNQLHHVTLTLAKDGGDSNVATISDSLFKMKNLKTLKLLNCSSCPPAFAAFKKSRPDVAVEIEFTIKAINW